MQQEHAQEAKYANFRRRFLLFQLEQRNLRLFQGDFALAVSRVQKDYINFPRDFLLAVRAHEVTPIFQGDFPLVVRTQED